MNIAPLSSHSPFKSLSSADPSQGRHQALHSTPGQSAQSLPGGRQSAEATRWQSASVQVARQQSFELELITRDGDRLRLQVSSDAQGGLQLQQLQRVNDEGALVAESLAVGFAQQDQLQFSLEGQLDDDEAAAVKDLLGQLNNVAEQFFSGDPLTAFEGLQELGYDSSEIAGFSLALEQTVSVATHYQDLAVNRYRNVGGETGPRPGLALGQYVSSLVQAAKQADKVLQQPDQLEALLQQVLRPRIEAALSAEVDADDNPLNRLESLIERIDKMHDKLLTALEPFTALDDGSDAVDDTMADLQSVPVKANA